MRSCAVLGAGAVPQVPLQTGAEADLHLAGEAAGSGDGACSAPLVRRKPLPGGHGYPPKNGSWSWSPFPVLQFRKEPDCRFHASGHTVSCFRAGNNASAERRDGEWEMFRGKTGSFIIRNRETLPGRKISDMQPAKERGYGNCHKKKAAIRLKPIAALVLGWCRGTELNCPHGDFQSPALPTELPRREKSNYANFMCLASLFCKKVFFSFCCWISFQILRIFT